MLMLSGSARVLSGAKLLENRQETVQYFFVPVPFYRSKKAWKLGGYDAGIIESFDIIIVPRSALNSENMLKTNNGRNSL